MIYSHKYKKVDEYSKAETKHQKMQNLNDYVTNALEAAQQTN